MAGTQTNGFDVVLEVSELTLQNLISSIFDEINLLAEIIPDSFQVINGFTLNVDFDRDPTLTPSQTNAIKLSIGCTINIPLLGQLSPIITLIVGADVDRTEPDKDKVILDFKNKLYKHSVVGAGNPVNNALIDGAVNNYMSDKTFTLFSIPVNRLSTVNTEIKRVDIKTIDDTSSTNNDAIGLMLTFGNGSAGNLSAFTSAFSRAGAGAALAVNFNWICRNISPSVESSLGLDAGSFSGCSFNGDKEIRDGVRLTSLSLVPTNNSIRLSGTVKKEGFCYEASGTISADISVAIESGVLKLSIHANDPNIDVDIPWYCYLAGAIIGAIIGGLIFGLIGLIVGAILIPLILWIASTVIESVIENTASQITDSLNTDVSINLPGIESVLDTAFIDDLTVTLNMFAEEYANIKSEGILCIRNGQICDFDSGIVKDVGFGGGDIKIEGTGEGRKIIPLCGIKLAELNQNLNFDKIRRFNLYRAVFGFLDSIPFNMIGTHMFIDNPSWMPDTDMYFPNYSIYVLKTSDGDHGFFQVIGITNDSYIVKYKTYYDNYFTVQITGNFRCNPIPFPNDILTNEKMYYKDALTVKKDFSTALETKLNSKFGKITPLEEIINKKVLYTEVATTQKSAVINVNEKSELNIEGTLKKYNRATGNWYQPYILVRSKKTARLKANVTGNVKIVAYQWQIDDIPVENNTTGSITYDGVKFDYSVDGKYLTLSSNSGKTVIVPLKVTVLSDKGMDLDTRRCIQYINDCKFEKRAIPKFNEYLTKFDTEFGIIRKKSEADVIK